VQQFLSVTFIGSAVYVCTSKQFVSHFVVRCEDSGRSPMSVHLYLAMDTESIPLVAPFLFSKLSFLGWRLTATWQMILMPIGRTSTADEDWRKVSTCGVERNQIRHPH
jgi:hypothetical protein